MILAVDLIEQVPVWAWWIGSGCAIGFTVALLRIIAWFLGRFVDENKESWKAIKIDMSTMTEGINSLMIVTTKHQERLDTHRDRLDHHDEEIIEFRKRI